MLTNLSFGWNGWNIDGQDGHFPSIIVALTYKLVCSFDHFPVMHTRPVIFMTLMVFYEEDLGDTDVTSQAKLNLESYVSLPFAKCI